MHFIFLEPFFGGSHGEFAKGLIANSRYKIDLAVLPARYWKWRMRGAALHFIREIKNFKAYNGIITSSLLSLSDLKALIGPDCPPTLVYFHENQLTYPLAPGEKMDYQYGFTDITTALSADRILFNSHSHRQAFLDQLPRFIGRMPEYRPFWVTKSIAAKAGVLPPGCEFGTIENVAASPRSCPPLIIWNHRWEFDKNPEEFFGAVEAIQAKGIDFRLALLGEQFTRIPKVFQTARKKFKEKIVHWGHLPSRKDYYEWLAKGAVVVSTAIQENFGMAIVEAVRWGCLPLLPRRLCYPEILPRQFHSACLYHDREDLIDKLARLLTTYREYDPLRKDLGTSMAQYAWRNMIVKYDAALDELACSRMIHHE